MTAHLERAQCKSIEERRPGTKSVGAAQIMHKKTDRYSGALWILAVLEKNGFPSRLAGGCVRDRCIGNDPSDYDIATTALPSEVTSLLSLQKAKVVPTGVDHGTVTVVISGVPYEVTTLREDVKTDGRHAEVVFGTSFEKDAARRDFTINALFEDQAGNIYDYFGGQKDLRDKRLRFVGEAKQRIQEDYLRILRFFRFWARFDLLPDEHALHAIASEAPGLTRVSKERITTELLGILAAPRPSVVLESMVQRGVLSIMFGGVPLSSIDERMDACQSFVPEKRSLIRMVLLLGEAIRSSGADVLERSLRLSNLQNCRVMSLALFDQELQRPIPENPSIGMEFLDRAERCWKNLLVTDFLPAAGLLHPSRKPLVDWLTTLERDFGWLRAGTMPLDARLLMTALHLPAGPRLGTLLAELKAQYRNRQWQTPEEGLVLAAALLKQLPERPGGEIPSKRNRQ